MEKVHNYDNRKGGDAFLVTYFYP